MFFLVSNFFQFQGATTSTKEFFWKKLKCCQFQNFISSNFYNRLIVNSHNIEGFQQISNSRTCLQPNMEKCSYEWLPYKQHRKSGKRTTLYLIILGKIKTYNFSKNEHIFYIMKITLLKI